MEAAITFRVVISTLSPVESISLNLSFAEGSGKYKLIQWLNAREILLWPVLLKDSFTFLLLL